MGLQVPGVAVLTSQIDPAIMNMLAENNIAAVYLDLGRVDTCISNIVLDYEHGISEVLERILRNWATARSPISGVLCTCISAQRRKNAFLESAVQMGLEPPVTIDAGLHRQRRILRLRQTPRAAPTQPPSSLATT